MMSWKVPSTCAQADATHVMHVKTWHKHCVQWTETLLKLRACAHSYFIQNHMQNMYNIDFPMGINFHSDATIPHGNRVRMLCVQHGLQ